MASWAEIIKPPGRHQLLCRHGHLLILLLHSLLDRYNQGESLQEVNANHPSPQKNLGTGHLHLRLRDLWHLVWLQRSLV